MAGFRLLIFILSSVEEERKGSGALTFFSRGDLRSAFPLAKGED
jgi:hypothetical protein